MLHFQIVSLRAESAIECYPSQNIDTNVTSLVAAAQVSVLAAVTLLPSQPSRSPVWCVCVPDRSVRAAAPMYLAINTIVQ